MIVKMEYYTLKCDKCGKLYSDEQSGYSAWNDVSGALDYASEDDWIEDEVENHYCPDCYEYDDDDNLVLIK